MTVGIRSSLGVLTFGALLVYAPGCSKPVELPCSGVLITIDTTNTNALDIYGVDRNLTPRLKAMARQSLVFDRAHTVAPITLPAHASMMTGLYPLRHGVRENGMMQLPEEAETIAELARDAGFETAAFVSARVLSGFYGIDQGFDVFDEPEMVESRGVPVHSARSAEDVTEGALSWLEHRDEDRPFFLWLHYFDPHFPYAPPPEYLKRAQGNPYLAEVARMDHQIGRVFDALEEKVGLDKLTLAVVADHGEAFGGHGEATHSAFCYQETIQVPFMIRFSDGRRAGTRSDEIVSVVDLFPTWMAEMGLGVDLESDGVSLAGDPIASDRGVYIESYSGYLNYGWSPLSGWVDARGKYLHSSKEEYYDLEKDPGELHNLAQQGQADVESYTKAIAGLSALPRLPLASDVHLTDSQLAELRALGYAAAGDVSAGLPNPLDPSDRPSPVDRALQYAKFTKALGLAEIGQNQAAIKILQEVLTENPANIYALETLGGALLAEGQFASSIQAFESLLDSGPDRYLSRISLGTAYENVGRLEDALGQYEHAQGLQGGNPRLDQAVERVKAKLAAN